MILFLYIGYILYLLIFISLSYIFFRNYAEELTMSITIFGFTILIILSLFVNISTKKEIISLIILEIISFLVPVFFIIYYIRKWNMKMESLKGNIKSS